MEVILKESTRVNDDHTDEDNHKMAFIDSTVQEKNVTYPTDAKLHKKIIKKCWNIIRDKGLKNSLVIPPHIKGPVQRPTFPQPSEEPSKGVTCRSEDEDNSGPPGPRTNFKRAIRVLLLLLKTIFGTAEMCFEIRFPENKLAF